eukprot:COSAG05_NODE_4540_length_1471_cov_1.437318_2_plen_78_part_00
MRRVLIKARAKTHRPLHCTANIATGAGMRRSNGDRVSLVDNDASLVPLVADGNPTPSNPFSHDSFDPLSCLEGQKCP